MIRLEEITVIDAPIDRCFDLSRSVEVHLVANIHSGEQALAIGGITSGLPELSQQVTWRAKHFGVWQNLTSKFTAMQPPTYFQATMVKGIFRSMEKFQVSGAPGSLPPSSPVASSTTSWMIEIGTFLMRTESELILKSRQVIPGRLLAAGFEFSFPYWPAAARDLVARWRSRNFTG
jgi:hypothetical protein